MSTKLETLSADTLTNVTGGAGFWGDLADAGAGALNMVSNPIGAAYRFGKGTGEALRQGHGVGDSLANGLVRSAQTMNAPDLGKIPANPNKK